MSKDNTSEVILAGEGAPAPYVDGHQIIFNSNGTAADIIFFQVIPSSASEGRISGIPVVHLRLSTEQLDVLVESVINAKKDLSKRKQI